MGIVAYHQSATRFQAWRCRPAFFKEKNRGYCASDVPCYTASGRGSAFGAHANCSSVECDARPSTCVGSYGVRALRAFVRQPAVSQPLAADGLVCHGLPRQRHVGPPPTAIEDIENRVHHGTICARLPVPAAELQVDIRRHHQV